MVVCNAWPVIFYPYPCPLLLSADLTSPFHEDPIAHPRCILECILDEIAEKRGQGYMVPTYPEHGKLSRDQLYSASLGQCQQACHGLQDHVTQIHGLFFQPCLFS